MKIKCLRNFKPNYLIIPVIAILTAYIGGFFTSAGMAWYKMELLRPEFTPHSKVFSIAWTVIFALTAISALIFYNLGRHEKKSKYFWLIIGLFIANAVLNVLWSALFFKYNLLTAALIEMILLEVTTILIAVFGWHISKTASWLLAPYIAWVAFATYLTYAIVVLN